MVSRALRARPSVDYSETQRVAKTPNWLKTSSKLSPNKDVEEPGRVIHTQPKHSTSGLEREKERAKPRKAAARSENKENEKAAPKKPAASTRASDHTAGHGKVCAQREVRDGRDAEEQERPDAPAQTAQKRRAAADQPGPAGKRAKSNGMSGGSSGSDGSREAAAASGEGTTAAARKARAKSVAAAARTKETREAPRMHPHSCVAGQLQEAEGAPEGPGGGEQQGRARKPAVRAAYGQRQGQEGGATAVGKPDAAARRCSSDQGPPQAPAGAAQQDSQIQEKQGHCLESPTAFQKLKDRYHDLCQRYQELKNVTMEEVDNVLRRHGEVVAKQSESAQKLARMWKEEAARQQQLLQQALASAEHKQLQHLQDEKDALERSLLEKEAENLRLQRELAMASRRVSILSRGSPETASVEVQVTPPSVLLAEQGCQYPSPQPTAGFATPSTVRRRRQVTGLPHALVPEGVMQGEVPSQIHSGLATRPRQQAPAAAAANPAPDAGPLSPGGPQQTSMQPPLGRSPLSEGSPRGQLQLQSADAGTGSPQPDPASSAAASCPRPAAETPAPPAGTRNVALSPLLPAAALLHSLPATLRRQHPQRTSPNLESGREDGQKAAQQPQPQQQPSPVEHGPATMAAPTASEVGKPMARRGEAVLRQRAQRSCMQPVLPQNAPCLQAAVQQPAASAAPPASSACAGVPGGPVEPPAEASAALEQHHASSCEAGSWLQQQQRKLEQLEQLYSRQKGQGGAGCEASGRPANPPAIAETEAQGQSAAAPAGVGEMQEGEDCPPAQAQGQGYAAEGEQQSSKNDSAGMDGAPVQTLEVHAPADGSGGDGCANDAAVPAATQPQQLGQEPEPQLQHEQLVPGAAAAEGHRPTGAPQHPLSYLSTLSAEEQEDGSMRCVHGPTGFAFVLRRSAPSRSVSGFDGLLAGSCQDRALTELLNYAPLTDDADALQLPPHFQEPIEFPATAAMRSKFMQQLLAALDTASSRLRPQPPVAA